MRAEIEEERRDTDSTLRQIKKEEREAKEELKELKQGRKAYPKELEEARLELQNRLQENCGNFVSMQILFWKSGMKDGTMQWKAIWEIINFC